jgi:UDP-N-acetylglucosamine:LPS N-acetylglucosamine transferase
MTPTTKVLFFCRGRGRGHAIPDIEVARELAATRPDLQVQFVSYGTGGVTLRAAGYPVIDMNLDEDAPYLESLVCANRIMAVERPQAVISHEEFAVLPAAKTLGFPTILMVDFFAPIPIWVESLRYADVILFIERRGIFPEPPGVRGKVRYLGPIVRQMTLTRADRDRCREDLSVTRTTKVVSVIPGAWASEERAPIFDLVMSAFRQLRHQEKKLLWIAGRDSEALAARLEHHPDVTVLKELAPIEQLMVASDLVLTKANRGTTVELASLGIPSVSLSFGLNPIDEMIIPRIATNTALHARSVDADFLSEVMTEVLSRQDDAGSQASRDYQQGGARVVAAEIAKMVGGQVRDTNGALDTNPAATSIAPRSGVAASH